MLEPVEARVVAQVFLVEVVKLIALLKSVDALKLILVEVLKPVKLPMSRFQLQATQVCFDQAVSSCFR